MRVVVDASVTVKWFFSQEPDRLAALAVLDGVGAGRVEMYQPNHWLTEVLAVISRQRPDEAAEALAIMRETGFVPVDEDRVYLRACELAARLGHHLFDTLYHAVALERDAVLITSDDRYFAAARKEGQFQQLNTFDLSRGA